MRQTTNIARNRLDRLFQYGDNRRESAVCMTGIICHSMMVVFDLTDGIPTSVDRVNRWLILTLVISNGFAWGWRDVRGEGSHGRVCKGGFAACRDDAARILVRPSL